MSNKNESGYAIRTFRPGEEDAGNLVKTILHIQRTAFSNGGIPKWKLENDLTCRATQVVLLKKEDQTIGITYAQPISEVFPIRKDESSTAYVSLSLLAPEYRGRQLIWGMIDRLHENLVRRKYLFVERDTLSATGFAEKIRERYFSQLVSYEANDHPSPYGPQRHIRLKLRK